MALYTVVKPCVAAGKHYTRPHATPVEVSATEAKPLVAAGALTPVEPVKADPEPRPAKRHTDDGEQQQ